MRRKRSKFDGRLVPLALVIGFPVFLLMEHPVLFWWVLVPLSVIFIVSLVKWFKGDSSKYLMIAIIIFLSMIPFMLITSNLDKCEHEEMVTLFSFEFENSSASSHIKPFCENCNNYFGYTLFRGTPKDTSYLKVVMQNIDGQDVKAGEYYTMSAVVTQEDYDINRTRIRCKVESDNIMVGFSVEFKNEFEEQVSLMREGDEITFRGRLYDDGFGWTDCELIEK